MIGLVVVSHSRPLAEAAVTLAEQMTPDQQAPVAVAASTSDGGFGTDAAAVSEAITRVAGDGGAVVLTDLGSAILSAEMALEFLPDPDLPVRIVAAPFVEGLVAAIVRTVNGGSLDEVAEAARTALGPKVEQLSDQPGNEASGSDVAESGAGGPGHAEATTTLTNPHGLHARPAAAVARLAATFEANVTIVAGQRSARADSPMALAGLGTCAGDQVQVRASGPQAEQAVAAISELVHSGFGETGEAQPGAEEPVRSGQAPATHSPSGQGADEGGIGVSPGRVVGPAVRMPDPIAAPATDALIEPAEREHEAGRIAPAADQVAQVLSERAEAATGTQAEVLEATAALARDPGLVDAAAELVSDQGLSAPAAVWQHLTGIAAQFAAAGGVQAERATDVRDVRDRVVATLTGAPMPGVPESDEPFILAADDLAPADTAGLRPQTCLGLLTSGGGPTAHTTILARALGIPAVVAAPVATTITAGQQVLLDGTSGQVLVDPSDDQLDGARTTPPSEADRPEFSGTGSTADGHLVPLLANIGGVDDVEAALAAGAEGVGLFRTEFSFLGRTEAPSRDEQRQAYRRVFEAFSGRKVVVRTLDAGSDKPLPFVTLDDEENPALGVRGYRTVWRSPEVLDEQLAAIAEAAEQTEADVWVMAPMIATPDEAAEFAERARGFGLRTIGVMVEVPAAALRIAQVFGQVDFVSIGTNDLAQYTMGADRLSSALARLNDPWQPAVLQLVGRVGSGADGRPAGVCGEAASDPMLACVLVGLGITTLSMTPRAIAAVGAQLARVDLATCQQAAQAALAATSPTEAKTAATRVLEQAAVQS